MGEKVEKRKNEIYGSMERPSMQAQGPIIFEVPVIDVPLPSNGLVYPNDSPLHEKTSITIKAMTTSQENILTNSSLAKRGTMLTTLLQSCMQDKNINVQDMLMADRHAVMVALRISGYGADYSGKVKCSGCDTVSDQTFRLDQLPLKRLTISPIEKGMNLFEFKSPSGTTFRIKFLTGKDEEDIAQMQQSRKKLGIDASSDLVTTGLMSSIVSINGITNRAELNRAIPQMPTYDSNSLREFIKKNEPGVEMKGWVTCPQCDFSEEVKMPMGASFFWPQAE